MYSKALWKGMQADSVMRRRKVIKRPTKPITVCSISAIIHVYNKLISKICKLGFTREISSVFISPFPASGGCTTHNSSVDVGVTHPVLLMQ